MKWWTMVVEKVAAQYHKWLAANPLDKLKVEPPRMEEIAQGNERLAQRAATMLMQAVPSGMRSELVAARHMDVGNILFKIYKTYQPGGLAERRQMLAQLTGTRAAATPSEAVGSLRLWKRQAQRAAELHATMPDPVLQVRALTNIHGGPLGQRRAIIVQSEFISNESRDRCCPNHPRYQPLL